MQNLNVALIQPEIFWQNRAKNLEKFSTILDSIKGANAVFLPETFTTGFTMDTVKVAELPKSETHAWMTQKASEHDILLTGSIIVKDGENYHNRIYALDPEGNSHQYDKRHLFRMGDEHLHYKEGTEKLSFNYLGWKFSAFICYDLRFPVWCRNTEEADVMYFVASWPEVRIEHWKSLLIARAIENQCYVIGVSRVGTDGDGVAHNGCSMIIDPRGNIIDTLIGEEGVIRGELDLDMLQKYRKSFPARLDSDNFELARDLN